MRDQRTRTFLLLCVGRKSVEWTCFELSSTAAWTVEIIIIRMKASLPDVCGIWIAPNYIEISWADFMAAIKMIWLSFLIGVVKAWWCHFGRFGPFACNLISVVESKANILTPRSRMQATSHKLSMECYSDRNAADATENERRTKKSNELNSISYLYFVYVCLHVYAWALDVRMKALVFV